MDSCSAHARMAGGFSMTDGDTGGLLLFIASLAFLRVRGAVRRWGQASSLS